MTGNLIHPAYYTSGGMECIEAICAMLTPEEYRGFLLGNVEKYIWRSPNKGGVGDLEKAKWYLEKLIEAENEV